MKTKLLFILLAFILPLAMMAQSEHLKFKCIPIDGIQEQFKNQMVQKANVPVQLIEDRDKGQTLWRDAWLRVSRHLLLGCEKVLRASFQPCHSEGEDAHGDAWHSVERTGASLERTAGGDHIVDQ